MLAQPERIPRRNYRITNQVDAAMVADIHHRGLLEKGDIIFSGVYFEVVYERSSPQRFFTMFKRRSDSTIHETMYSMFGITLTSARTSTRIIVPTNPEYDDLNRELQWARVA